MPGPGGADDVRDMGASKGLIALLAATVVVGALWFAMLKPGGSNGPGGTDQGTAGYQSAIAQAHQTVKNSVADAARVAGENPSSPSTVTGASSTPTTAAAASAPATQAPVSHPAKATRSAARHSAVHTLTRGTPATRLSTVQTALRKHKVLAMLFYNPAAADDQAVKQELATVPTHRGRVVKLTIPLGEIANYTAVTEQVPVNFSPTLVLIAPNGQADEIVGFSDQFEIAQRVDDALAVK
jgi:hypothetical protein